MVPFKGKKIFCDSLGVEFRMGEKSNQKSKAAPFFGPVFVIRERCQNLALENLGRLNLADLHADQ